MSDKQNGKNNSIIEVTECWECPLSYVTAGSTWCSHPDGPRSALHARECSAECPLRKAPALVMLKEQADEISSMLTRLGERLFGNVTKPNPCNGCADEEYTEACVSCGCTKK